MKQILTHIARDVPDLVDLLKVGGFCCPRLPHYRYRTTQAATAKLNKAGMLKFTGKTDTGSNYTASDKFRQWLLEFNEGKTKLQPIRWAKEKEKPE